MKRIKRIFLWVHIVLWVLFSLLISIQLSQDTPEWESVTVGVMLTSLYVFYSHFFFITNHLRKKRKGNYFLKLTVIISTGPFFYLLSYYKNLFVSDLFFEYYLTSLISNVLPFIFLSWLAKVTQNLVFNTIIKEQLEKQAVEAELFYLKSQINPHFLFNTLNNIHTLVYKQASTAPEAVMRLSSLMRYMIYDSNSPMVPLSKEMDYLQDYISLQQLRYKNGPVVEIKVTGDANTCFIAPLLFIHFLENAYKHSPARLDQGDITVFLEIKENNLIFQCKNPVGIKKGINWDEPGGFGLYNVQKRLKLLYLNEHSLLINKIDGYFIIELKITNLQQQIYDGQAHLLYN